MLGSGDNPCNICKQRNCEGCALHRYNTKYLCSANDCFLNYEGSCMLSLYDDCGCRKYFDGENNGEEEEK